MKNKRLHEPVRNKGLLDAVTGFLEVFRDMEANGETERIVFGSVAGPLDSGMVYRYKVTIGLENAGVPLKRSHEKKRIVR